MKKYLSFFLLLVLSICALAQDQGLVPDKFLFQPGEIIRINTKINDSFPVPHLTGSRSSLHSLTLYYEGVKDILNNRVTDSSGRDSLAIQLFDPGGAMLCFLSTEGRGVIDSSSVDAYLRNEKHLPIADSMVVQQDQNKPVSSSFQLGMKSILQVGETLDNTYALASELPLDIIPINHPYSFQKPDTLRMRILFQKHPLAHCRVNVWHWENGQSSFTSLVSDEQGQLNLVLQPSGRWLVCGWNAVPMEKENGANWQYYWGGLSWGYPNNPGR